MHAGVAPQPLRNGQYVRMRTRWLLALGATVSLVAAVLFAVLPYTVPVRSNGTNNVECDGAIVQVFGSPQFGVGSSASRSPDGSPWVSTKNFKPPCLSVAHYRLGIATGLLLLAIVFGLLIVFDVRRERRSAADEDGERLHNSA